jgi:hypothetical protein
MFCRTTSLLQSIDPSTEHRRRALAPPQSINPSAIRPRSKCSHPGMDTVEWTVVEAWTLEGGRRLRSAVVHSSSAPAFQSPNGIIIELVVGPIRLWHPPPVPVPPRPPLQPANIVVDLFRCDSDLVVAAY